MIGRGVLGNPWLIKECIDYLEKKIEPQKISKEEKLNMILRHLNNLRELKDDHIALLEIRSHAAWYLKGIKDASKLKQEIFVSKTIDQVVDLINNFIKETEDES